MLLAFMVKKGVELLWSILTFIFLQLICSKVQSMGMCGSMSSGDFWEVEMLCDCAANLFPHRDQESIYVSIDPSKQEVSVWCVQAPTTGMLLLCYSEEKSPH